MRAVLGVLACVGCRAGFDVRTDATPDVPTDGCAAIPDLLAYFPMEPGDIAGNVLFDRSGNARDGTIFGAPAPTLSAGHDGNALDFTATTTSYVDIGGLVIDENGGAAVTVTAWFFEPATQPNEVLFDFPPPNIRYDLWLIGSDLCINTQNGECWGVGAGYSGRWVHVAAILRNGLETASELYVDGAPQQVACTMAVCTSSRTVMNPLRLGAADSYAFHGKLDEVRLYGRALAAGEIAAIANGGCP